MKTSNLLILTAALLLPLAAGADAYKCQAGGKTVYQARPCAMENPDAGRVAIKAPSAVQEAAARQKREAIEQDRREYNLNRAEVAVKRAQATRDTAWAIESINQAETDRINAATRQREAESAKRESEARARYWDALSGISPTSRARRR